jgi:hypothetical protein
MLAQPVGHALLRREDDVGSIRSATAAGALRVAWVEVAAGAADLGREAIEVLLDGVYLGALASAQVAVLELGSIAKAVELLDHPALCALQAEKLLNVVHGQSSSFQG